MALDVKPGGNVVDLTNKVGHFVHDYSKDKQDQIDLDELSEAVKQFSDKELRLAVSNGKTSKHGDFWPLAVALSESELERRRDEALATLTKNTTQWAAVIGAGGAIVGAVLGAWLASL